MVKEFIAFLRSSAEGEIDRNRLAEIFREFSARERAPAILSKEIETEIEKNPRFFAEIASSSTSIQECLIAFKRIVNSMPIEKLSQRIKPIVSDKSYGLRTSGSEVKLKSEKMKVCGFVDGIVDNEIFEFKTGARSESHARQLKLYSLLYLHQTGHIPKLCKLIYTNDNSTEELCFDLSELREFESEVAESIALATSMCNSDPAPARPNADSCRWCAVRHLCDAYWCADETSNFRFNAPEEGVNGDFSAARLDVELIIDLDGLAAANGPFVRALTQNDKSVVACIEIPTEAEGDPKLLRVRMLSALVRARNGVLNVSSTKGSETYWLRN